MDYYKKVIQNEQILNEFLDKHNLVLEKKFQINDRAVLFCEKTDPFLLVPNKIFLGFLGIAMMTGGHYGKNLTENVVVSVDDFGFVISGMSEDEKKDLSKEWQEFLYKKFGFAYANHLKKVIAEEKRKQDIKKENSRELPL